ncbi:MAG: prepilin-type N-terminal cleavage/methylation domain-containing protein [Lachnospiraceae bacterium]|nr:prepilin-type N-terminal cleavage/methylation domain-containing protein [Lachnospiraceae bacterium]
MKRLNKKGFTLAELLIVVAIIAVLVAIAIPIFTSQLEKAREATDAANIRAAYAEVQTAVLTGEDTGKAKIQEDGSAKETIALKQHSKGWQNSFEFPANLTEDKNKELTPEQKDVEITATESGASININLHVTEK